jgi:16S rRNA C967 or C1407 C5-methylase (RsmB/RsmF family)/NOL1/NOP2/fmu family ribosome biogenesis protein
MSQSTENKVNRLFPAAFLERLGTQDYIDMERITRALSEPSPVSVRINRSKIGTVPSAGRRVEWCNDGFYLPARPAYTLDPLFHAGCYYPQEASGMFLEEIFRQTTSDNDSIKVLDLCAAPGGKSTHLSTLIGEKGLLVSNEVIRQRASVLAENLTKWGIPNAIVTQSDPSSFAGLPGFFDMILVDAPCSGEGMFRDAVAVNEWSPENAAMCSERQKRILMDVWPALKENGILIYSTCTFNPAENEENVRWLLSKHAAESVKIDVSVFPAITLIEYQGVTGYGFHPGKTEGDGLFFSVMRKLSSVPGTGRNEKSKILTASKEEARCTMLWSGAEMESLIKAGDNIISFPGNLTDYGLLSGRLRIIRGGTHIMTVKQNKYIPSHELAVSGLVRNEAFRQIETDLNTALAYLRRDSFSSKSSEKGWQLVKYKSVNLGFVNNLGSRLNNYYPVEWRIRMNLPDDADIIQFTWE